MPTIKQIKKNPLTLKTILVDPSDEKICSYQFNQTFESDEWIITHNCGANIINFQVFDDQNNVISNYEFTQIDLNSFKLNFINPQSGFVNFFTIVN
jgi:hypothetical protein